MTKTVTIDAPEHLARPYCTTFYNHKGEVVKSNNSANPNRAAKQCFGFLQENYYSSGKVACDTAQVWERDTGKILVEMARTKKNEIVTTYKYNPDDHKAEIRRSVQVLFQVQPKATKAKKGGMK